MECLGCIAACLFGLSLGLYFGRLLTAIITYWESARTAEKAYRSIIAFLVGGSGGAAIWRLFSASHVIFYLIGLASGMVITYFWPRIPRSYTLGTVTQIIKMNEAMRDHVPEIKKRALLILASLVPPRCIEREEKINERDLAKQLEEAIDVFQEAEPESADSPSRDGAENSS